MSSRIIDVVLFVLIIYVFIYALFRRHRNRAFNEIIREGLHEEPKVLLLIAHPDDESVFFAPTLMALRRHKISTHILCLSPGDYEYDGAERTRELISLAKYIGIPEDHVEVKSFPDQPGLLWDPIETIDALDQAVKHWDINVVISFDNYGVSGHANHVSCYRALRDYEGDVKKYILNSFMRRYSYERLTAHGCTDAALLMLGKHRSQDTWWRRLRVWFGVHSRVNQLHEIRK